MTDQELYDRVKSHLLTQQARAETMPGGACRYRAPDGRRCAIGCLISDDQYQSKFEGHAVSGAKECCKQLRRAAGISEQQLDMAESLQGIHDYTAVPLWEGKLRDLAVRYGLTP